MKTSIKFTGERTGMTAIAVPKFGSLQRGDVIEVSPEQAESWTTKLPTATGELEADFAYVGAVGLTADLVAEDPEKASKPGRSRGRRSAEVEEVVAEVPDQAAEEPAEDAESEETL